MNPTDAEIREMVMAAIGVLAAQNGGWVTRSELSSLQLADGTTFRAIDQSRGIRNPRGLDATLSVISSPRGPYRDEQIADGLYRYDYRAGGPGGDNRKLVLAYELGVPIILLLALPEPGFFAPVMPCYVTDNDPQNHCVYLAVDQPVRDVLAPSASPLERRWVERLTRHRVHQAAFRGAVLHAYQTRCTVCELKHAEFLDAAHIIGDREDLGDPVIENGLTLCKIHHAAYDQGFLGISPDYQVHVDRQLLVEKDGPMLRHGLQEMHGRSIEVPARKRDHPDPDRLAVRYAAFADRQS